MKISREDRPDLIAKARTEALGNLVNQIYRLVDKPL